MTPSIAVSINALKGPSLEADEAESVEVRIGERTYVISATDRDHLLIETVDEKSMRVMGFTNMVKQRNPSPNERITQGEIIVGNTVELS